MYVVILACIAGLAGIELFHWGLHAYGYGITSVGALAVLCIAALLLSGWGK